MELTQMNNQSTIHPFPGKSKNAVEASVNKSRHSEESFSDAMELTRMNNQTTIPPFTDKSKVSNSTFVNKSDPSEECLKASIHEVPLTQVAKETVFPATHQIEASDTSMNFHVSPHSSKSVSCVFNKSKTVTIGFSEAEDPEKLLQDSYLDATKSVKKYSSQPSNIAHSRSLNVTLQTNRSSSCLDSISLAENIDGLSVSHDEVFSPTPLAEIRKKTTEPSQAKDSQVNDSANIVMSDDHANGACKSADARLELSIKPSLNHSSGIHSQPQTENNFSSKSKLLLCLLRVISFYQFIQLTVLFHLNAFWLNTLTDQHPR
jgi:hypothetical protein